MISLGGRCVVTATGQFAYRPPGIAALALAALGYGLEREGLEVVGTAKTITEALAKVDVLRPDGL